MMLLKGLGTLGGKSRALNFKPENFTQRVKPTTRPRALPIPPLRNGTDWLLRVEVNRASTIHQIKGVL
jgi:hypothetical protein